MDPNNGKIKSSSEVPFEPARVQQRAPTFRLIEKDNGLPHSYVHVASGRVFTLDEYRKHIHPRCA